MKTHRVLNRSTKYANARYCKNIVYIIVYIVYSFTKISNIQCTFLRTFTKENSLRNLTRFHGGLFELELEFFAITAECLLKNEKKSGQKRCKPPKNCLT